MDESQQDQRLRKKLWIRVKNIALYIWRHIKSWQFVYLFLFGLGQLLSIFLNDPSNVASYYSPLFLLVVSFLIKIILLRKRITWKIFGKMQLEFASPYVLTIINIVLLAESSMALGSFYLFNQIIPNLTSYTVVNSLQLLVGTLICSLVMNKRTTTKMEYYMILINIVIQAGSDLIITINTIQSINGFIDSLRDDNQSYILQLFANQISQDDYVAYYEVYSQALAALQGSKDFSLACVASIISVLIILMDFIARPLEKLQHQEEIYSEFIRNYNLPLQVERNTRNTIKINQLPQSPLTFPLIMQSDKTKQIQLRLIRQNFFRNSI